MYWGTTLSQKSKPAFIRTPHSPHHKWRVEKGCGQVMIDHARQANLADQNRPGETRAKSLDFEAEMCRYSGCARKLNQLTILHVDC